MTTSACVTWMCRGSIICVEGQLTCPKSKLPRIASFIPCGKTGYISTPFIDSFFATNIAKCVKYFISANSCQLTSPLLYSKQLHRVKDISREFVFYLSNRAEVWNSVYSIE